MPSLLLHFQQIVDLLICARCFSVPEIDRVCRVVRLSLVRAACPLKIPLFSFVDFHLLLSLNFEIEGFLDLVGCRRRPVRLGEEGAWPGCYEASVLKSSRAHRQHLRISIILSVDVEDSLWIDIFLAVAQDLHISSVGPTCPLLAERELSQTLVLLGNERATRFPWCFRR